jgi:hypothetical protein
MSNIRETPGSVFDVKSLNTLKLSDYFITIFNFFYENLKFLLQSVLSYYILIKLAIARRD